MQKKKKIILFDENSHSKLSMGLQDDIFLQLAKNLILWVDFRECYES